MSRQIDVIIYERDFNAPVYEDEDIAIVSPEAVRGIIEVKGTLSHKHLKDAITAMIDFSKKWQVYRKFRDGLYFDSELINPGLYLFFWEEGINKKSNNRLVSPKAHREAVATATRSYFAPNTIDDVPIIAQSEVYSKYGVHYCHSISDDSKDNIVYLNSRGQYVVFDAEGIPGLAGDKTLDSILRNILCTCNLLNNRFLIDPDETGHLDVCPPDGHGETIVFSDYRG